MIFIIVLAFILFFLFLFINVTIDFNFNYQNHHYQLQLTISTLFGLVRFTRRFPSTSLPKKMKGKITDQQKGNKEIKEALQSIDAADSFIEQIFRFHQIAKRFLKTMRVRRLEWQSVIGTKNAAQTGMLVGFAWTVKGNLIATISRYTRFKTKPVVQIQPMFQQNIAESFFQCMVQVRLGHAIFAGIQFIRYWKSQLRETKREKRRINDV
ncbi:DUF2953 domain-containing protein [Fervidibacillus albus]|uniref:DUF2953 domain-containing protein n=1 Tax=Fervidibacillus albus TaxID=2980026 RepID=A0A9E8LXL0_9BACI|nr:DUF2953 domain-containing protein [Fervidibacillus albus]WAA11195.1 DUF2953 domain-containing protein [Fervidibacillus albus]